MNQYNPKTIIRYIRYITHYRRSIGGPIRYVQPLNINAQCWTFQYAPREPVLVPGRTTGNMHAS